MEWKSVSDNLTSSTLLADVRVGTTHTTNYVTIWTSKSTLSANETGRLLNVKALAGPPWFYWHWVMRWLQTEEQSQPMAHIVTAALVHVTQIRNTPARVGMFVKLQNKVQSVYATVRADGKFDF